MNYKVAKIEKTNDGIEVEIHFLDENEDIAESRKFLYNSSLSENELEESIRRDAGGVNADNELRLENAERDRQEGEVDKKIEGLKASFGL